MADLSPAGPADRANLADREGGHVVVEHELLAVFVHDAVNPLLVGGCAQHGRDQSLCLAALENRRTVGAGQEADLAPDRPQVARAASVGPLAFENQLTNDPLLDRGEGRLDPAWRHGHLDRRLPALAHVTGGDGKRRSVDGNEVLDHLVQQVFGGAISLLLEHDLLDLPQPIRVAVVEDLPERVGRRLDVLGDGQAHGLEQIELKLDDLLIQVVGPHDRVGHLGFGQFFTEALDHHDGLRGAGNDQVQVALLELFHRRKGNELALDTGQSHGPDRPLEGRPGQKQRRRGADDRGHVGVVLPVGRDRPGLDLHLFVIPFRKEGADRPVDESGGEDLLGGWPALTLDEAAGKLARGIGFFSVIDGEGEEVEPFATRRRHGGDQRHGVADPHDHGTAGLLGQEPGLQADHLLTDGPFNDLAS